MAFIFPGVDGKLYDSNRLPSQKRSATSCNSNHIFNFSFSPSRCPIKWMKSFQLAVFDNGGPICSAASRTLENHRFYDEFVTKSVQLASQRRLGHPFDPATDQNSRGLHNLKSALNFLSNGLFSIEIEKVNATQCLTILNYIQSGLAEGVFLQCRGQRWGRI